MQKLKQALADTHALNAETLGQQNKFDRRETMLGYARLSPSHAIECSTDARRVDNNALNRSGVHFSAFRSSDGRNLPLYPTTFRVKLTLSGPLG